MPSGAGSSGGAISRPSNEALALCIEKLAARVAKVGLQFETVVLQKQGDNPEFAFLKGGEGADYYQAQKESAMRLATPAAAPSYVRLRGLPFGRLSRTWRSGLRGCQLTRSMFGACTLFGVIARQ